MSSTIISTRSFHEVKKNGKVVDKKVLDATYDGNKAIIDNFHNNRAYRYELSRDDIEDMIKQMSTGKIGSLRIKDPSKLGTTVQHTSSPVVASTPTSSQTRKKKLKEPRIEKREKRAKRAKRMRSAGRSVSGKGNSRTRTRAIHGKHAKHATRGRNRK